MKRNQYVTAYFTDGDYIVIIDTYSKSYNLTRVFKEGVLVRAGLARIADEHVGYQILKVRTRHLSIDYVDAIGVGG